MSWLRARAVLGDSFSVGAARADRPAGRRRWGLLVGLVAALGGLSCASSSDLGFDTVDRLDPTFAGTRQLAAATEFGIRLQVEQLSGMIVYDLECEPWGSDYHLTPRRHSGTAPRRTLFDVHLPAEASRDATFFWVTREGWLPIWQRDSAEPSQRVEVELTPDAVFEEEDTTRVRVDCV